jgi:hypothetical protein
MIKVWSAGKLSTENPVFFRTNSSDKAYLIYKNTKTEVSVIPVEDQWQGEFRVSLPGTYKLQVGTESYPLEIQEYQRLAIHYELIFTALAVALFFMVLSFKRRRPRDYK